MKNYRLFFGISLVLSLFIFSCNDSESTNNNSESDTSNNKTVPDNSNTDNNNTSVQKTLTLDQKIEIIRKDFKSIEDNLNGYTLKKSTYRNPEPEMYYDYSMYEAYYDGGKLVKLVEMSGEEGYGSEVSYYFKDSKLFFIFTENTFMEESNIYSQSRVYFYEGQVIRAIFREKDIEDEKTDLLKMENIEERQFKENPVRFTEIQALNTETALDRLSKSQAE